jgi:hypothetical protein
MQQVTLHTLLGQQVIALPEEYQFDVNEVYLVRDGAILHVIAVSPEGDQALDDMRRAFFTDPVRMEEMRSFRAGMYPRPDDPPPPRAPREE